MKVVVMFVVLAFSVSAMAETANVVQKDGARCAKSAKGLVARTADGLLLSCKNEKWQKI